MIFFCFYFYSLMHLFWLFFFIILLFVGGFVLVIAPSLEGGGRGWVDYSKSEHEPSPASLVERACERAKSCRLLPASPPAICFEGEALVITSTECEYHSNQMASWLAGLLRAG
jgi:hypothetical protein